MLLDYKTWPFTMQKACFWINLLTNPLMIIERIKIFQQKLITRHKASQHSGYQAFIVWRVDFQTHHNQ